jgi:vacuolar-type H+-ATPase subunit E/Vma4
MIQSAQGLLFSRALARARALAEQVRETAERVHQQAREETHRLTEVARHQAERGRELSKAARDEARGVVNSIKWGVDTAANGKSR